MILAIVTGYLCVGCLAAFIGPAAKDIRREYQDVAGDHRIKARFFVAALVLGMAILWPVLLPSAVKTVARRKQCESSNLIALMGALANNGTDQDMIPGASGQFGLTVTNPIPTRTPMGSKVYLDRLRTVSGEEISWSRVGSTGAGSSRWPIDMYTTSTREGGHPVGTLFVSPYHKRNSGLAPNGFKLVDGSPPAARADRIPPVEPPKIDRADPDVFVKRSSEPEPQQTEESDHARQALNTAKRQLELGIQKLAGANGSPKDLVAAEFHLREAALLGDDEVAYILARAYCSGTFGVRDKLQARFYAHLADERGHLKAASLLRSIDKDDEDRKKSSAETPTVAGRQRARPQSWTTSPRVAPDDALDFALLALGTRQGRKCRADARERLARSKWVDPHVRGQGTAVDDLAHQLAVRRGLLHPGSNSGMKGKVDGADPLFEERRAIFVSGVEQCLSADEATEEGETERFASVASGKKVGGT